MHGAWGFFPFAKLRVRMTRCTQFGPPIRVSLRMPIYEMAFKIYGCLLLLVLAQPGTCAMRAGAASAVITPKLDGKTVYLAGFGHNRIASAVHDPLYVRCLALQAENKTVVLCSADLIGLFYDDVLKIREIFRAQAPCGAQLVVASTHTHEGPDTLGLWGPSARETGVDLHYLEWVDHKIAETAVAATRNLQAARIRLGRDDSPLLAQLQSVDRPPYVKDPFVFVMQASRLSDGGAIATMVNFTDHPETLNRKNTEITADYPHWICQYLEQRYGGIALFFNGALGKVSTLGSQVALLDPETGQIALDGAWRKPELLGNMIGRVAERALEHGETVMPDGMVYRSAVFFVPLANDRFRMAEASGVLAGRKPLYSQGQLDPYTEERAIEQRTLHFPIGRDLESEAGYLQLKTGTRALAEFITVPGEIYPELVNGGVTRYPGADFPDAPMEKPLRSLLKSKYQFILGLGNDELGYIIPKSEWDEHEPWLNNSPQPYYGEINSVGPDTASAVLNAIARSVRVSVTAVPSRGKRRSCFSP
jgi:hypothetical protein